MKQRSAETQRMFESRKSRMKKRKAETETELKARKKALKKKTGESKTAFKKRKRNLKIKSAETDRQFEARLRKMKSRPAESDAQFEMRVNATRAAGEKAVLSMKRIQAETTAEYRKRVKAIDIDKPATVGDLIRIFKSGKKVPMRKKEFRPESFTGARRREIEAEDTVSLFKTDILNCLYAGSS